MVVPLGVLKSVTDATGRWTPGKTQRGADEPSIAFITGVGKGAGKLFFRGQERDLTPTLSF